jgi:hypothetical protein
LKLRFVHFISLSIGLSLFNFFWFFFDFKKNHKISSCFEQTNSLILEMLIHSAGHFQKFSQ